MQRTAPHVSITSRSLLSKYTVIKYQMSELSQEWDPIIEPVIVVKPVECIVNGWILHVPLFKEKRKMLKIVENF